MVVKVNGGRNRLLSIAAIGLLLVCSWQLMRPLISCFYANLGLLQWLESLSGNRRTTEPAAELIESRQFTDLFDKAVSWDGANQAAHRMKGFIFAAKGQLAEALTEWRVAGLQAGDFIKQGNWRYEQDQLKEEALTWYQWATQIEPEQSEAWYYVGRVYQDQELWGQALDAYRKAVSLDSLSEELKSSTLYRIGLIYHRYSDPPQLGKALVAYESALQGDGPISEWERADTLYQWGVIQWQHDHGENALAAFEEAVELAPYYYSARVDLAWTTWLLRRDYGKAESELIAAIELRPESKRAYRMLSELYWETGHREEAYRQILELLRIDPQDQQARERRKELELNP